MNLNHSACQPDKRCMLVSLKAGGDFSRGCTGYRIAHLFFATDPTRRSGDEAKLHSQRPSGPFCRGDSERPRLDPACGSGNFLGDSMQQLLNSQRKIITFARDEGLFGFFPSVGPEQVHGIEPCNLEMWRGFFEVVCAPCIATAHFSDPPPPISRIKSRQRHSR